MQRPGVFHRDHCFEYPKTPDKIKPSKQILAKFSYPKNPRIENFNPSEIFWSSLSLEICSSPVGFEQAWPHTINDGSALDPIGRSPFLLLWNLHKVARTVFCFYITLRWYFKLQMFMKVQVSSIWNKKNWYEKQ